MVYWADEGARKLSETIFAGWNETIIWSCLQGMMGNIYVDHLEKPTSAVAVLGDFCFFAGQPNRELAALRPVWRQQEFIIAVPQNNLWGDLIESQYMDRANKVVRYAMKKEAAVFDKSYLRHLVRQLPSEYSLHLMDRNLFEQCKTIDWCKDFVSQFKDWQIYQKIGLGVLILKDRQIVAGASSYSAYVGGIEIEIDTKIEFRRRGLALICGAKLITECLERDWYPSWDAQNLWSVSLAEKLGYHLDYPYEAYEIVGSESSFK